MFEYGIYYNTIWLDWLELSITGVQLINKWLINIDAVAIGAIVNDFYWNNILVCWFQIDQGVFGSTVIDSLYGQLVTVFN